MCTKYVSSELFMSVFCCFVCFVITSCERKGGKAFVVHAFPLPKKLSSKYRIIKMYFYLQISSFVYKKYQ